MVTDNKGLESIIIEFEDRLANTESFCKDLEIRFVEDVQAKPRINERFIEERLRVLEHYQKVFMEIFNTLYSTGKLDDLMAEIP